MENSIPNDNPLASNSQATESVDNFPTSEKEAYFKCLRVWVNQANLSQNAMACFPYYLMANYPQLFQGQRGTFGQQNTGIVGFNGIAANGLGGQAIFNRPDGRLGVEYFDNDIRQAELINQNGGYEFVIAPFWKRVLAEIIDVAILLLLKLIITFTIVDLFDLDIKIDFDLDALKKTLEDDYTEFLSFSSDLLILEILTKFAVCFYEAFWTMTGHIYVGGATPGKVLLGLRIVYVEAVVPLQPAPIGRNVNQPGSPLRVLLYPASNPGFKRAFSRAIAKNILMALLFPMCFIMLFFKNNRTAYDVMTKTIVVEENHAPFFRRR